MSTVRSSTVRLCCMAVLAALIVLMTLTGIGYIPLGPLKLTLLALPVAIGGAVLGPTAGLILGTIFGLTSFFTCFGMDALGTVLLGIRPWAMAVVCIIPRMLAGYLPALLAKWLRRRWNPALSAAVSCGLTAGLNTLLFLGSLWWLFGKELASDPQVTTVLGGSVNTFAAVLIGFAGVNALVEIALNLTVGTAVSAALVKVLK